MSGRRQKLLRKKNNREDKLQKKIELRKLASLPCIPVPKIAEFLASRFIGKSGYHYISVGKAGSLFLHKDYSCIVPITLHNNFPIMSAVGRFNDPNKKDCAIGLVKITEDFPGLVVDRHLNIYLKGESTIVPDEIAWQQLCDLQRVTVDECNEAVRSQKEIFEDRMKKLNEIMLKSSERMDKLMNDPYLNDPYADPYLDSSVLQEDMTDFLVDQPNENKA